MIIMIITIIKNNDNQITILLLVLYLFATTTPSVCQSITEQTHYIISFPMSNKYLK